MSKHAPPASTVSAEMRMARISRLLQELEYEVTRGIMQREIDETIAYRWIVPSSKSIPNGIVGAEFRTRPLIGIESYLFNTYEPKLKLVDKS